MIVYISGPMTGYDDWNKAAFHAAEVALNRVSGDGGAGDGLFPALTVLNPARNFGGRTDLPREKYLAKAIRQVLKADALVLLPDWSKSPGAVLEAGIALETGKNFFLMHDSWSFQPVAPEIVREMLNLAGADNDRVSLLDEAKTLVTGDRNNSYGPPDQDFTRSADAMTAYGYRGPRGRRIQSYDVAILILLVKVSRLMWKPDKRDSWVDIAGYAACGLECANELVREWGEGV